ncbi:hypothetical protein GON03_18995 [Nocardioides sp. MAH-18]|uniref:Tail fiber assembly protein n=1 Tax=Nocardioides agri TaxID=2682843 RepID=A0A6L6XX53_9ACTN|nr:MULTISPECIES: hypothetical protein [unclassified Nocardioides]MBA2952104.1 hypothetical protein [Nocardioides sp. CGMCC 1.13656]MVQ51273.1 hypothetical protein [Nocardioides sp. MAH-18]
MIPEDAWPAGDRRYWTDDETRLHYDFTETPYATAPYTAEDNAAADERAAKAEAEANRATLADQVHAALTGNRAFLALTSPTNAQVIAQVRALTRQMNTLIRLTVNDLSGTD